LSFSYNGLALKGQHPNGQRGQEVQVAEEIWITLKQNYNSNQIETVCFLLRVDWQETKRQG
jgi:hypothetical protein